jgi:hypothetical protein
MRSEESLATISILRRIAREPHIGGFSTVAFNLERNQILYRVPTSSQVDFPALGKAIKLLNFNMIDFHRLRGEYSSTRILGDVILEEMTNQPDAVIFVGSRTTDDRPISRVSSIELKAPPCPVFLSRLHTYSGYVSHRSGSSGISQSRSNRADGQALEGT